jgi:PAS domain S-box-containing protein
MIDIDQVRRFAERVQVAHMKAAARMTGARVPAEYPPLAKILGELDDTWEELLVAEEELRQQNDEILSSREGLEQERQRYRWLFDFAPDAYVVTNRHGMVRDANRIAVDMLRTTAAYVVGKPLVIFVARDRRFTFRTALAQVPQLGRMGGWDLELQPRQGPPVLASTTVAAMPTPADGEQELLWAMRDTAEWQQAETERRSLRDDATIHRLGMLREHELREQAQKSDEAKDQFLGMISHELRAPLTALIGWVHLLARGDMDEASRRRALEIIERSTRTQVKLIDDLLDVSRMLSGRLRIEQTRLDLAQVVTSAVDLMRPVAEQNGLWFACAPLQGPIFVRGDEERLQQVLVNLISNAIKFSTTGGRVDIKVGRTSDHVKVIVEDQGVGIGPEFLPRVFDRFTQAHSGTSRTHGGLGLGLAIARHIVESHQGVLRAESAGRGQGATFWFQLPILNA